MIEVFTTFIHMNINITRFKLLFRGAWNILLALVTTRTQIFVMFFHFIFAGTRYIDAFQLIPVHQSNSRFIVFCDVTNCFVEAFCSVDVQFNSFYKYLNVIIDFN